MKAERQRLLINDLCEAMRKQRHAEMHRLTRLLAGNGIGVKRRRYSHTPAFRPGKEELKKTAMKQAGEGG